MQEISKIKLPDGSIRNIADDETRRQLKELLGDPKSNSSEESSST